MVCLADMSRRQKVTKVYLNIPYLTLSLCYKLKKSYRDPKSSYGELKAVKIRDSLWNINEL